MANKKTSEKKTKSSSTKKTQSSKKNIAAQQSEPKKVGKLQFTVDTRKSCIHLRFYAEQCGYVPVFPSSSTVPYAVLASPPAPSATPAVNTGNVCTSSTTPSTTMPSTTPTTNNNTTLPVPTGGSSGVSMQAPNVDIPGQLNHLRRFLQNLQATQTPFFWAAIIHDQDTVLGKADQEDDFWHPAIEKPHCHLLLWYPPKDGKTVQARIGTVLNFLATVGFAFRKGNSDDFNLIKKGIRFPNMQKKEHVAMYVYLTHETFDAIKDGKFKYDRSLIYTNLSDEARESMYNTYDDMQIREKFCAYDFVTLFRNRGYEGKGFDQYWQEEVPPAYQTDRTLKRNCQDAWDYGADKFVAEKQAEVFVRCSIFISGPPACGKTITSKKVLDGMGRKVYAMEPGQKTGKTDGLDSTYGAIVCSDTSVPGILAMSDNMIVRSYKRMEGCPIWAGDYLVVTFNNTLPNYIEAMGYKDFDIGNKRAIVSRFNQLFIDEETGHLKIAALQTRDDKAVGQQNLQMLIAFVDAFNKSVDEYQASDDKPIDLMAKLMSERPDLYQCVPYDATHIRDPFIPEEHK